MGGYAFGDSAPAARRLGLLADVFEPPSREFLKRFSATPGDLAVDHGCGPRPKTRLVAAAVRARRTVGLDHAGVVRGPGRGRGAARGLLRRP